VRVVVVAIDFVDNNIVAAHRCIGIVVIIEEKLQWPPRRCSVALE